MAVDQEKLTELAVNNLLGLNTASQPTALKPGQFRSMKNSYQKKLGSQSKRPGSVPVIASALAADIKYLTEYQYANSVSVGATPALSAIGNAGSTLPAATYYVRYTYVTDYGETEASNEASVVCPPAVANPTVVPVLAQSADGTETLPDTTYYVAYTWKNAVGETMVSGESSILIVAGNKMDITIPALPAGATSASIYAGTVSGTLYYQANIVITTHSINAPILTVTAPPVANTCIISNLRVVVPAIPYHANSINIYISTTTNTEKKQVNTTNVTYNQTIPLAGAIAYPTSNTTAFRSELLATSGTTLYAYYNAALHAATMTNALETASIYSIAFTDSNLVSILFITDGGDVKKYNGSAVANITPAADDAAPAPANALATINTLNPVYCWVHKSQIFVSTGNDTVYYSKPFFFDYFPVTSFIRFVRNNDYITGPGVTYSDVLLIPMRRGWGLLTGTNFSNFVGNQFLNTINGCIAARSIQRVTYSNGEQTILFLSDDGVYEIYDTGAIDSGSRQYATRSKMAELIDFNAVGFTDAEKSASVSYFDQTLYMYILLIKRDTARYAYCLDVRNGEWYLWTNIKGDAITRFNNVLYYAGEDNLLIKFDDTLATDWNESTKVTGTAVDWDIITDILAFEDTGYPSYLDYLIVWAKQFPTASSIDVTVVFTASTKTIENAIQNVYATWDQSLWDVAVFANLDYTDLVGAPPRIILKKKAYFFQIRFRNPRNELVEMHRFKLSGRVSGG